MEDVFTIGKKLRHLREERKYKQEAVAMDLGVSTNTYSDYERGVYHVPSEVVVKATKLYGVGLDYFYSLRGPVSITMNDQASNGYVENQIGEGRELVERFFQHMSERDKRIEDLLARALDRLGRSA